MNEKQYKLCEGSEVIERINPMWFPLPEESELIQIVKNRIIGVHDIPSDTLSAIINKSDGTPRKVFQGCEKFLFGCEEYNYITQDEDTMINEVLYSLGSNEWVKVKEIRFTIMNRYKHIISDVRLGMKLKKLGMKHRYNPDSEYRIGGSKNE